MKRALRAAVLVPLLLGCTSPAPVPTASTVASVGPSTVVEPTNTPATTDRPSPSPAATSGPSGDPRVVGWRADVEQLISGLETRHPQLAEQVSLDKLRQAADDLSAQVATLTDDEMLVGVMRLVAMVSAKGCDAHTGAYVWGGGTFPVTSLPLRLWLFGDDVYIVDAMPPYEQLVGHAITEIDGVPIADVVTRLDPIVPRDNDQTVRLLMPRFLLIPQILRGAGIPVRDTVTLQTHFADLNGLNTVVTPIAMPAYNSWAGAYGLHLPADPEVPYLSRIDDILWWETLADGALFVQYNQTQPATLGDLQSAVDAHDGNEIILDLRHNFGGEVSAVEPMVSVLKGWLEADPAHHLTVATARNTFSAASLLVARLDALPNVDIVGEPMGGCPSGWGNSRDFNLSYSGIPVSVATTFETGVSADDLRLTIPVNIPLELTIQNWLNGIDPVLASHEPAVT